MQNGRDTLSGIEDALRDLKTQEAALQGELEEANKERASLVADRLDAMRELASIRARDAFSDGVIDEADNLSHQVRTILEARQRTILQLKERHVSAEAERDRHVARQDALTREIAALEERLDRVASEARAALATDRAYADLVQRRNDAAETYARAKEKAERAALDEQEKGAPYRGDPLFMYLWQRKFGSAEYTATGLVKVLDQWVAGLVKYTDARANYAMLTEIPVRLRAHADDLSRRNDGLAGEIEMLEAERTLALAGADLVGELTRQRDAQSALGKDLERITSELAETGNQLRIYAKGEDSSFISAVASYATFLDREPPRRLMADARATPGSEDDRAVEQITKLANQLEDIEERIKGRRRLLDQIAEKRLDLSRVATDFRRQRYDDVGSQFNDSSRTEDLLQLLLRGAITAADYWMRMKMQQSWRHRPADPWRRRSGLPPFDGFPSDWGGIFGDGGGGGGGGGRGKRGGSSGKDFETGGSF
jgi:hypothetical protein